MGRAQLAGQRLRRARGVARACRECLRPGSCQRPLPSRRGARGDLRSPARVFQWQPDLAVSAHPKGARGRETSGLSADLSGAFLAIRRPPPITAAPITVLCSLADAATCDPVPGDRPGRDLVRPPRDPLVRARLYCRAADRLAVLPRACQPAAISGGPAECGRLSGVGHTRRRPRRTPRLCPVLHAGLLRISPAGGTLCLAW